MKTNLRRTAIVPRATGSWSLALADRKRNPISSKPILPRILWTFFRYVPLWLLCSLLVTVTIRAGTLYVWQESPAPTPPFTGWPTAAHTIQDAVDAANAGDEIVVTNGVYATGKRVVRETGTRVVVDKPVLLESVNGPAATVIEGYQLPGLTNGEAAVRCVYLANGAVLSGFTLTQGATRTGGNPYEGQSGGGVWCESENALLTNCTLVRNSAYYYGGGCYRGTLSQCALLENLASYGGGGYSSSLSNCAIVGNSAKLQGGGAAWAKLYNCTLTSNSAAHSGGATHQSTLRNCTATGNTAAQSGGGASFSWLYNCILYYNTVPSGPDSNHYQCTFSYSCTAPLPSSGVGNLDLEPQLADTTHISEISPCRHAGYPAYANGTDIDGDVWNHPPSIGCDEYRAGQASGPLSVQMTSAWTNVATGFAVDFRAWIEGDASASAWDFGDGIVVSNRPYASHTWTLPGTYAIALWAWNEDHPEGVSTQMIMQVVGGVHYVAAANPTPVWPYDSWTTAARRIQDAVDASIPGNLVLVSNGVYATGGKRIYGTLTNRVAVDKPLVVQSVNGPEVTIIQGFQIPGTTNGNAAVRCVYLTNGAVLSGFTLINGATHTTDWPQESGGGVWGESTQAVVTNCTLRANAATSGGGSCQATLNNCTLVGNSALGSSSYGGGAYDGALNHCVIIDNSATHGGGVYQGVLNDCTLTGNRALSGGGVYSGTLNRCVLTDNVAADKGGGAFAATVNHSALSGNLAAQGGGAAWGTLNHCTITGNSAQGRFGGGTDSCKLTNCIVYFNSSRADPQANYSGGTLNFCCTTPLPSSGLGNIDVPPELASSSHLGATSPCIGAGSRTYTTDTDIDAEDWANPPSIGCDEYGQPAGPLKVGVSATYTRVSVGYGVDFKALIEGQTRASVWDFGDGTSGTNRPLVSHIWMAPGWYPVTLRAWNHNNPEGVSAVVMVEVIEAPRHYVMAGNSAPVWPFTSWATAAPTIQDAVDAVSVPGAEVLVGAGVYATGGRAAVGTMTNRVLVDRPMVVRSINGSESTIIQGCQVPGSTNGDGAIRCVYLANGAVLSGFTLTNGATRNTGDDDAEQNGGGIWCESVNAVVTNCTIISNSAAGGGGGAYFGTLNRCKLVNNTADSGGGAYASVVRQCMLDGNVAASWGGGAWICTLENCALTGNSARNGGGAYGGTLIHCTVTGNSGDYGAGTLEGTANNCILYYNAARSGSVGNYFDGTLNYCCTTPLPPDGTGNVTFEPQLASASHLSAVSPCIGAGSSASAPAMDIDGEAWSNLPSIGCDEYWPGAATGPLNVSVAAAWTNVALAYPVTFRAAVDGQVSASAWDFGDGVIVSNRPFASHAWAMSGTYVVEFRAWNETHPEGALATVTVQVTNEVHYVATSAMTPTWPFESWATAAATIQEAVDAALVPGALVLVSNGVYAAGGRAVYGAMTNRVVVDKPVVVQSVNGPEVTAIQGDQLPFGFTGDGAVRCVYLASGGVLDGFTLTNGATRRSGDIDQEQNGGGIWCESTGAMVTNCNLAGNAANRFGGGAYGGTFSGCTFTRNSAMGSYSYGGGVNNGVLNHCTLVSNSSQYGGGASASLLNNCALTGNSASYVGGGVHTCTLNNCTLSDNSAAGIGGAAASTLMQCILYQNIGKNYDQGSMLRYSCAAPLPPGAGNIDLNPLFADNATGNLHLQPNSPCINTGINSAVVSNSDLGGNPRLVGGTVDLGAYEFQSPSSVISYAWLQQYGLPTDGSADFNDADNDLLNNWQEWRSQTDPTNALSVLRLLPLSTDGDNVTVGWESVAGVNYLLEYRTNLSASPIFQPLARNVAGQPGTTTFTDTNATGAPLRFYRVGVQAP